MTYIIAGKNGNKPFMMVDSVATGYIIDEGEYYYFKNKLFKLKCSNENVYFTLSGSPLILELLIQYDSWLNRADNSIDFHINPLFNTEFKFILDNSLGIDDYSQIDCEDNRLYFISDKYLIYYDIQIRDKISVITQKIEIQNKMYLGVHNNTNKQIPLIKNLDADSLRDYCRTIIANELQEFDFKNRFSFIYFGEEFILDYPDKEFSDIINGLFRNDYYKLDADKYKWKINVTQ